MMCQFAVREVREEMLQYLNENISALRQAPDTKAGLGDLLLE